MSPGRSTHRSPTGCSITEGTLSCTFEELLPGAENAVEIHVAGETDIDDCEGLLNSVTVGAANEPEEDTDNNTSQAPIAVGCPELGITKVADHQAPVSAGYPIGFTVELFNHGDGTAFDVSVDDLLPAGFDWVDRHPGRRLVDRRAGRRAPPRVG